VYVNGARWGLEDRADPVPIVKTNQYAEMYAVKMILLDTLRFQGVTVNIRSDSMYTINTLTKWHGKWKWNEMKNSAGKKVKHVELIAECLDLMRGRSITFLKVKSHCNIW
jgi:ribonuclease HI